MEKIMKFITDTIKYIRDDYFDAFVATFLGICTFLLIGMVLVLGYALAEALGVGVFIVLGAVLIMLVVSYFLGRFLLSKVS
jgi:Zn-dependent protease with chaperone function